MAGKAVRLALPGSRLLRDGSVLRDSGHGPGILRTAWWLDNLEVSRAQALMLGRQDRACRLRYGAGLRRIFADGAELTGPEVTRLLDGETPAAVLFGGPLEIIAKEEP